MRSSIANLKDLNLPTKVLFTGYLGTVGIGYFFALVQVLFTHGMADGKFGLSVDDIVYSYYGNRSGSVMETKLNGSMKDNATEQQRFDIIQWVRDGADIKDYKAHGINKIIEQRCVMCHNKSSSTLPDFADFEQLKELTEQDNGETFSSLTRVSHIHLFGISFIFMFVGIIFNFSETTSILSKSVAVGMPYVFLISDILSWWLTKFHPMFAWVVIIAGMGMAISFMFMWVTAMLEMWMYHFVYVGTDRDVQYKHWKKEVSAKYAVIYSEKNRAIAKTVLDTANKIIVFVGKSLMKLSTLIISKLSNFAK
jgi:hypothetical protein